MTRLKDVDGLVFANGKIRSTTVTIRVTKDHRGESLSLSDEHWGIMLLIPVEKVKDMIEVKPWENSD